MPPQGKKKLNQLNGLSKGPLYFLCAQDYCMNCLNNALRDSLSPSVALYDIPYNFVIGESGDIFECRGWNAQPEPILLFPPDDYIFIGISNDAFAQEIPGNALNQLILDGQNQKKIGEPYMMIECDKTCRDSIYKSEHDSLCMTVFE